MILFLPRDEWVMVKVYEIMEAVCRENTELLFPKSCDVLWALTETFGESLKPAKEKSYFEYCYLLSLLKSAVEVHCTRKFRKEKADKFHSSKSIKRHSNEEIGTYLLASLVRWRTVEEYERDGQQRDRIMSCLQARFPVATAGDKMDY